MQPELQARCKSNFSHTNVRLYEVLATFNVACSRSVTAPNEALLTCREYFANAPRRASGGGAVHDLLRRVSSLRATCSVISRRCASIVIASPVLTKASGPPSAASGDI